MPFMPPVSVAVTERQKRSVALNVGRCIVRMTEPVGQSVYANRMNVAVVSTLRAYAVYGVRRRRFVRIRGCVRRLWTDVIHVIPVILIVQAQGV